MHSRYKLRVVTFGTERRRSLGSACVIFDVSSGFYLWNVNRTTVWHLWKKLKFAFKDVSTKNSELSVSSFAYKYDQWPHDSYMTGRAGVWEADDIDQFYIALLDYIFVSIPYIGLVFTLHENRWRHFTDNKSCQIIESILKYKNGFKNIFLHWALFPNRVMRTELDVYVFIVMQYRQNIRKDWRYQRGNQNKE
jgi:hypothetical protein